MRVAEFLASLREKGTLKEISLTPETGKFFFNGKPITFQIRNFGKPNEEVIMETFVDFPFIPEVKIEDIDKNEIQASSEWLGDSEGFIPKIIEKIIIKEVIKEVPVEITKEKIVIKEKILPFKIKIV